MASLPLSCAGPNPYTNYISGWHTLKQGAGGLITGFDIATDGTMVFRTDTYGAYRWSGTISTITNPSDYWVPMISAESIGGDAQTDLFHGNWGSCECVIAPSNTSRLYMITLSVSDPDANG